VSKSRRQRLEELQAERPHAVFMAALRTREMLFRRWGGPPPQSAGHGDNNRAREVSF
jgi:hypothetical protein